MGMLSRMATVVKSKMNRLLDNAENLSETLDLSYEQQLQHLRKVKQGVVENGDHQATTGAPSRQGAGERRKAGHPGPQGDGNEQGRPGPACP